MTPEELRAHYDIPANAAAMCDLLMKAHPGWNVRRLGPEHTFQSMPVWVARHRSWPASVQALTNENAGLLNLAMTMADKGAVVS